jgi:hypothetical protein
MPIYTVWLVTISQIGWTCEADEKREGEDFDLSKNLSKIFLVTGCRGAYGKPAAQGNQ